MGLQRPGQHQGLSHRGCRWEEGLAGLAGDLFLGRLKKERGFRDKPKTPAWAIRAHHLEWGKAKLRDRHEACSRLPTTVP